MLNLTDENFHAERVKQGYLLVDFFGVWCPPCKAMNPILEKVEAEFPLIVFAKVNATENPELSTEYRIQSIPFFILFKDGEVVDRWSGLTNYENFCGKLPEGGRG